VRTDSWGKLAFVTTQTVFAEKPLPLTGFGEQRQVLFIKLKFSSKMADILHDGIG
jgi:hypothetical protein